MNRVTRITWPALPALPPPGQAVLVHVPLGLPRPAARPVLRAVLRTILVHWSGLPAETLPLCETAAGPAWSGELHGAPLNLSLTYAGGDGWIALRRGGLVGVDALLPEPFAELPAVARLYLGPETAARLEHSPAPANQFVHAWTAHEARLKCLRLPLTEWSSIPPLPALTVLHPPNPGGPVLALALAD